MDYKTFIAIGVTVLGIIALLKLDNKTIESISTTALKECFGNKASKVSS